jgi:hypothetical protein
MIDTESTENTASNIFSIVARVFVAAGMYLLLRLLWPRYIGFQALMDTQTHKQRIDLIGLLLFLFKITKLS